MKSYREVVRRDTAHAHEGYRSHDPILEWRCTDERWSQEC